MKGPIFSMGTGLYIDGAWQSGVGREGAHEGMLEFLEKKYIAVDW